MENNLCSVDIRINAHVRLLKFLDQYKTDEKTSQALLQAVRINLEMNPVEAESNKNEIAMMIRMELSPAQFLFVDSFLKQPLYAVNAQKCS